MTIVYGLVIVFCFVLAGVLLTKAGNDLKEDLRETVRDAVRGDADEEQELREMKRKRYLSKDDLERHLDLYAEYEEEIGRK